MSESVHGGADNQTLWKCPPRAWPHRVAAGRSGTLSGGVASVPHAIVFFSSDTYSTVHAPACVLRPTTIRVRKGHHPLPGRHPTTQVARCPMSVYMPDKDPALSGGVSRPPRGEQGTCSSPKISSHPLRSAPDNRNGQESQQQDASFHHSWSLTAKSVENGQCRYPTSADTKTCKPPSPLPLRCIRCQSLGS